MAALNDQLAVFKSATYWGATGKLGKGFGVAYPDDAIKVQAYVTQLDAGHFDATPPTGLATLHAQGLVGMLSTLAKAAVKPPPPPTESPDNTIILAGSGWVITDAAGHRWSITSDGKVAVDGVADPITSSVTRLMYEGRKIWQENTSGFYWYKMKPTDSWLPTGGTKSSPVPGETQATITGVAQAGKTLKAAIV